MNFNYIDDKYRRDKDKLIKPDEPLLLKCTLDNEIYIALGLCRKDFYGLEFVHLEDFRWEDKDLGLPFYNINIKRKDLFLDEEYIRYWIHIKDIPELSWIKYKKLKEFPTSRLCLARIHKGDKWYYAIFERRHHFITDPASRSKYSDEERTTYTVAFYSGTEHIIAKQSQMNDYIIIDEYFINK